jgi:hypothetical protein
MPPGILTNVPGMKDAMPVKELPADQLSEQTFINEYVANSQPCLIRRAVKHWPAIMKWRDKDYLKRSAGHHGVDLFLSEYHITLKRVMPNKRVVTFAEAVDVFHSENIERAIVATEIMTEFLPDLGGLPFLSKAELGFWYIPARYFFYRNAGTAWHYHPFDETLTCQIVGTKRIGLVHSDPRFNPALRNIFFAEDYYDDPAAFAQFDSDQPCWLSATLEEGDALYIPPLWWHGVSPLTTSFGATAAVTWRSPQHVIANGINRMARGEIEMLGGPLARDFQGLADAARKMGLARELAIACERVR